ncbi:MAG: single-stranded DNA-binding protein [Flavobacteriaceae bacterium]|jgi:single-strand DNA-binding protein|nr:single-stranded DNA-binding protein [Flavobacteriaceae bacterium]|tara:strand:+ start:502 stop:927 length:426 start_codon:yes stop_codon:yes gene_type:complete
MSGTINKVILIGHIGDDIKMHYFDGGGCLGRFPLATNESYTNKSSGEKVTQTQWHNIVVKNKAAEIFEKYITKGDKIYIEGKLKTRKWVDSDQKDRYSTEIIVNEFTFLSSKTSERDQKEETSNTSNDTVINNEKGEDLPF